MYAWMGAVYTCYWGLTHAFQSALTDPITAVADKNTKKNRTEQ